MSPTYDMGQSIFGVITLFLLTLASCLPSKHSQACLYAKLYGRNYCRGHRNTWNKGRGGYVNLAIKGHSLHFYLVAVQWCWSTACTQEVTVPS